MKDLKSVGRRQKTAQGGLSSRKRQINKSNMIRGFTKERDFINAFNTSKILRMSKSSRREDIEDYYDFTMSMNRVKVQYKTSNSESPFVWIEIKNVRGKLGSLFGKADVFIYDLPKLGMKIVSERGVLLDIYEEYRNKARLVSRKENALYNFYRRKGNRDIIMRVPILDLLDRGAFSITNLYKRC